MSKIIPNSTAQQDRTMYELLKRWSELEPQHCQHESHIRSWYRITQHPEGVGFNIHDTRVDTDPTSEGILQAYRDYLLLGILHTLTTYKLNYRVSQDKIHPDTRKPSCDAIIWSAHPAISASSAVSHAQPGTALLDAYLSYRSREADKRA